MACFLVPAAEAAVTTVVTKVMENQEKKSDQEQTNLQAESCETGKEHFSSKLKRLNYMLWGGSGLLAFEHLWHGEIAPFFPFLTAAGNPADTTAMLHEMSTVGVSMAVLVTAVWGISTFVSDKIHARNELEYQAPELEGQTPAKEAAK